MRTCNNTFVFVVCGQNVHIKTLNFSLKYLKLFSKNTIIVVTDLSRNEIKINHNNIIDVKTPTKYNNHQASIWLKTSLHKILPKGNLYCYLDSDVITVNFECNYIFSQFTAPITFAADHCKINSFSPYAINCNCYNNYIKDKESFEKAISEIVKSENFPPNLKNENIANLYNFISEIRNFPIKNFIIILKLLLCLIGFESKINNNFILSKKRKGFISTNSNFYFPFLFFYRKQIKKNTNYYFNFLKLKWLNKNNAELAKNSCIHIITEIKNKFGITISNNKWQHWNGGVFLFNDESHNFMETWHQFTLQIFDDDNWKTRDQGTLIATAWKFNLSNHALLNQKYNFIADYYKQNVKNCYIKNNNLQINIENKQIEPCFVHVYHQFGNKNWDLWNNIESIYDLNNKNKISENNRIVHGLWIGDSLSNIEILTIKSFINCGHTFWLWTYQNINNIPENTVIKDANEIIPKKNIFRYKHKNQYGHGKGSLGGFSDVFRYKLLYEYGGWWTDMDVTCIKPLNFDEEYVFRTHHELKLVGNIIKCPPKSQLMLNCYERAINEVNENNRDWNKPINILVDEIINLKLQKYIVDISNADSWALIRKFLIRKIDLPENWYVLHWVNEEWKRNKINKNYFINGSVLSYFMNKCNIAPIKTNIVSRIIYSINLFYLISALRQLPSFVKRKFS